ncbi:MAG TPA: DNA-binding protein [Clostridiales bacterium]|jgi:excisionase family DNA binding protein/YgiT-type zinc finger domain-containing protein|nr:helix-turn-helix domain-containing protein [Clostridia bacterium]HCS73179.1 DNA-binding protein [Clostridiales bacterium]
MIERNCYVCGTKMEEKTVSTSAGWGKYNLTLGGINAFVCPECGETVYSSEEMHMMQELSKSLAVLEQERPEVLNVKEVADLFRVSSQTVYNMIKDGRLNPVKMGREWRFIRKDIESVIHGEEMQTAVRGILTKM